MCEKENLGSIQMLDLPNMLRSIADGHERKALALRALATIIHEGASPKQIEALSALAHLFFPR